MTKLIKNLVEQGPIKYTYYYNQTASRGEMSHLIAEVPKVLKTLAKKSPEAETFYQPENESRVIKIQDHFFAVENLFYFQNLTSEFSQKYFRTLPKKVWAYIALASGDDGAIGWHDKINYNEYLIP